MLTDDEIHERLEGVQKIKVSLDSDPLSSGLASLNKKIAEIQGNKGYLNALFVEALRNKTEAKISYEIKKTEYQMELDKLMATDEEVKTQKNAEARKSLANVKANVLALHDHNAKIEFLKADTYCMCVQQHYSNMESAFESLSRQITVLQLGVNIGDIKRDDLGESKTLKIT